VKILVVEDDPDLRHSIQAFLTQEGYTVETAADFLTGFNKSLDTNFDCALVDLTIPGGNGLSLVKSIKKYKPITGVIIISARNSTDDKVTGLELGADDYLAKPFHFAELHARIKSLARRLSFTLAKEIEVGLIHINTDAQTVYVNKQRLSLTPKEYDLLLFFIRNKERVLSKEAIAGSLWNDDVNVSYDFIYTHIKNLRKKLSEAGCSQYIQAIYGTGYRFSIA
jgi:DNA-binding response OmpR family regulator